MRSGSLHQNPERKRGTIHQSPERKRGVKTHRGNMTIFITALATLAIPLCTASKLQAQARAPQEADFQKLLAEKTPAIVTIKFVLKTKSRWGESDNEQEATAVVIEPDGLVLCSKTELGGPAAYFRDSGTSTPTDIKVLIGDDTEGLDAKLIARDSELDLMWLRIKDPGERKFAYVDLRKSAVPRIGDYIYSVRRMDKYFDRIAVVGEGRIGGVTEKPRKLYVPSGVGGSLGLPVYNAGGKLIGVPIRLTPDREELESSRGMYGGWGLILPAEEVVKATRRAKEAADHNEEDDEVDTGDD